MSDPVIRPAEIDTLNEAQRVLDRIMDRIRYTSDTAEVRVLVKADAATDAIFDLLNNARAYCGVEVTHAQMHDWREVPA
jgi:hypothetical protein